MAEVIFGKTKAIKKKYIHKGEKKDLKSNISL